MTRQPADATPRFPLLLVVLLAVGAAVFLTRAIALDAGPPAWIAGVSFTAGTLFALASRHYRRGGR